ncbi:MAG: hypothetical protein KIS79_05180 [Burkholderiales bacterium]|nr:hypothetical protein [Burkholderiales bacterium]
MGSRFFLLLVLLAAGTADAVVGVNPFGVNVRSSGPTSIFLTFQALDAGEVPVEAFWCGELQPAVIAGNTGLQLPIPVQTSNPCVPGTLYGSLPLRHDRARTSTSGAFTNLTDVMTIPAQVARRAYQDAAAGANSAFFYVRRFSGGAGGDKYVVVTCRMAGGGARVPFSLIDVRMQFDVSGQPATVLVVPRGTTLPPSSVRLYYNGSGVLRGRWEVTMPGDPEPTEDDLLTEATLPVERRALQRRFTLIERFEHFLPPSGQVTLPGPDPRRLPNLADGAYKILLRVEASTEREGASNTGAGRLAQSGGVAGFPLPVLRYYVGGPGDLAALQAGASGDLQLLLPPPGAQLAGGDVVRFSWVETPRAALYRLEVEADGTTLLSALVTPGPADYAAPPWLTQDRAGTQLRWRLVAVDGQGKAFARSTWREFTVR